MIKYLFLIFVLASCGANKVNLIDEKDIELIPYKGREVLIFETNEEEKDTILLNGYERYSKEGGDFLTPKIVVTETESYYLNSLKDNGKVSYSEVILELNPYSLIFDFPDFKNVICSSYQNLDEFKKMKLSELSIKGKVYNDVKVLIHSQEKIDYEINFADKIYWSLSEGYLGFDHKELKYRLIEKYIPESKV